MTPTKLPEQRDYAGLVRLLPMLRRLPDAAGVVTLEPQEAEGIKRLGFEATAGPWRVPGLPARLVAGNPTLENLADNVDVFWLPRQAEPDLSYQGMGSVEQNQVCLDVTRDAPMTPDEQNPNPWNKESAAILAAINRAGGSVERRKLQKKFWRMGATAYNGAVQRLVTEGVITVDGNLFHTFPGANEGVPRPSAAGGIVEPNPSRMALAIFEKEK